MKYNNNAIAYCRVSTNKQKFQGISLSAQRHMINSYAIKNKLKIHHAISQVISGRNNYSTIMQYKKSEIRHIIVTDVTRFCRDVFDGLDAIKKLVNANKVIHFIKEDISIDKHSFENQLGSSYRTLFKALKKAEDESVIIGKRISNIKEFKKQRGEHSGGIVPFGLETYPYSYVDEEGNIRNVKKYRLNESEINIIEFIEKCRSCKYSGKSLSLRMSRISKYRDPIELVDRDLLGYETVRKLNNEPMTSSDIAELLNIYEVTYKGKPFTSAIINRIKPISELKKLVINNPSEFDEMVQSLAGFELSDNKESEIKDSEESGSEQEPGMSESEPYDPNAEHDKSDVDVDADAEDSNAEDSNDEETIETDIPVIRNRRPRRNQRADNLLNEGGVVIELQEFKKYCEFKEFQEYMESKKKQ